MFPPSPLPRLRFALIRSVATCGHSADSTCPTSGRPATRMSPLSRPPMRRARPPARIRPVMAAGSTITRGPGCDIGRGARRIRRCGRRSTGRGEAFEPAEIRAQGLGYADRPVRLLAILEQRRQRAAHGETRAIQRMHQLRLAGRRVAPARPQAPCLEIFEVAARGNLAIGPLRRQPHLQVVGLGGGETQIAGAQGHHAGNR